MAKIVIGDILDFELPIFHQCNCVTIDSIGLARDLFQRYPYANTYKDRASKSNQPGTIDVMSEPGSRKIINAYAQYYPGRTARYGVDTAVRRCGYFEDCLEALGALELDIVAIPWRIGCGLGGGDWDTYLAMINRFAERYPKTKVYIIRRAHDTK